MKQSAAGLQSSGDTFSGMTNNSSPSGNLMDESGFGEGWIMVFGCFSGARLGCLAPVKGILNASEYQDILNNSMLVVTV